MLRLKKVSESETELHKDDRVTLFSYETPVAIFDQRWDTNQCIVTCHVFSKTTTKHISRFLRRHGIREHLKVAHSKLCSCVN